MLNQRQVTQMSDFENQRLAGLIRITLEILWQHPEGLPARNIISILIDSISGSNATEPINTERDELTIRVTLLPLFRVGWLVKDSKGMWYLSEEGRQVCKRFANAQELYNQALQLLDDDFRDLPEITLITEMAQEKAREQVEKYLHSRRIPELRSMIAQLAQAFGYHLYWLAPPEKKYGQVDMIATTKPLEFAGPRIFIQIRHKGQAMTQEGIKTFSAILGQNDFGLIFSSGGFTKDARNVWDSDYGRKISLLDNHSFFDLWVSNYSKLSPEAQHLLPLKAIYFLSFHE